MEQFILFVFLVYFSLIIVLLEGWRKAVRQAKVASPKYPHPFISILIPVRNERENILNILKGIEAQDYPKERYEVMIINDHSDDDTADIIQRWLGEKPFGRLIHLAESKTGKKAAITEGVKQAAGDLIVTTDADCSVQPGWLAAIADWFDEDVKLVIGPVRLASSNNFFNSLQGIEFASLVGSGAATLALGIPTMCNGANMAYRKKVFIDVDGYGGNEHIASGDDEFLLRKIIQKYPKGIRFNSNPEGIVSAKPSSSFKMFVHQRLRWAGKWASHGFGMSAIMALFIFVFHGFVILLPWLMLAGVITLTDTILLLGGKLILEGVFLYAVLKFLRIPFNVISFLTLQVVYPVYVIFFAVAANFLKARWKGREIVNQRNPN